MGLADTMLGRNSDAQAGRNQIINGQTYAQYSPQWYDAMRKSQIQSGDTLGRTTKAAYDAMGNPADTSSSSSDGSGSGSLSGIANNIPRIGPASTGGPENYSKVAPVAQISKPDQSAAEAAQFGKAKDTVGQTTSGALAGLRSALGSRGMLGSGAEYRGTAGVFNKGQGELGDVARQQAVTHLSNEMDIDKANLGASVAGRGQDVTQRGQDMDYTLGSRGQDITQRGQDIQYAESQATLAQTKSLQEAARRQEILKGIMGAIGPTLY